MRFIVQYKRDSCHRTPCPLCYILQCTPHIEKFPRLAFYYILAGRPQKVKKSPSLQCFARVCHNIPIHRILQVPSEGHSLSSQPPICLSGTASLQDRKSTRLNSSHVSISYAVFCLKKKNSNS